MNNNVNVICPFCQEEISADAETAVCPVCGRPHHKNCWAENGGCAAPDCESHLSDKPAPKQTLCAVCGAEIPAYASFCIKCGAPRGENDSGPSVSAVKDAESDRKPNSPPGSKRSKKEIVSLIVCLFGLCCGIASVVLGIICFTMDGGVTWSLAFYGGDAYTGIQNAAAMTASNIYSLISVVKFGLGSILLVAGLAIVCYYVAKILVLTKK